jgi:archaeosortase B (VPXXXP-CTERM-specific)
MSEIQADPNKKQKGHLSRDLTYLKMPLLFCLIVVLLNILSFFAYQRGYLASIELLTAQTTMGVIHLFGMSAVRDNNIIRLTNALWIVNTECTAITIMIIYSAFIAVYKASLKAKGIGLLFGLLIIFTANITRLLLMAFIDRYKPEYSTLFHDYLWQVAFIIMVIFLWILWLDKVVKRETKTVVSG